MIKLIDTLTWRFESGPYVQTEYIERVDPTPCYYHNMDIITEKVNQIQEIFPINPETNWYILAFESELRVNGWTSSAGGWNGTLPQTYIVLSGKRTPIHPAVTRYMVGHEYGHAIHLCAERKIKDEAAEKPKNDVVYTQYAELRGLTVSEEDYGPGTWHDSIGEIFANDFRILNGIETEFWPHTVLRPEKIKGLEEFFADLKSNYAYAPNKKVETDASRISEQPIG